MSQNFGSGLRPVEIPHPEVAGSTSAGTTPTFSPANKPTPLVGSWADIGWEKAGEPNSATLAAGDQPAKISTPLLPATVSAFDGRSTTREGGHADEYLSNLLTATAKITDDGDESDDGKPPKRASTPPPKDSAGSMSSGPSLGISTYGRSGQPPLPPVAYSHHQAAGGGVYGASYGAHPYVHASAYPAFSPHAHSYGGSPPPHHQHHQHHQSLHHHHQHQHQQHHHHHLASHMGGYPQAHNPPPQGPAYAGVGLGYGAHSPPQQPQVSKFTPPPPPNVSLANELAATDSDTPPAKVGDILFALGRRWVQKLEVWLAAHPKERPNAPSPAAEQYTTIETWLEKLNAWYEANFNGRKLASGRGGAAGNGERGGGQSRGGRGGSRGSGSSGFRGGRGPASSYGAMAPVAEEQQAGSWGTAW
jgi:hypothetical protein